MILNLLTVAILVGASSLSCDAGCFRAHKPKDPYSVLNRYLNKHGNEKVLARNLAAIYKFTKSSSFKRRGKDVQYFAQLIAGLEMDKICKPFAG